jgi:hypothetical protein
MPRKLSKVAGTAFSCGLAWLALGLPQARAGFTVSLDSTSPSGSYTQFNYSASLTSSDQIVTGNSFTIYDFAGYVPGSITAPAGWTASVQALTPPPNVLLSHGDDPAYLNLTFTYTGSAPITNSTTITGFSAVSVSGDPVTAKNFVGQINAQGIGRVDTVGDTIVPATTLPSPAPAPEPSALVSGGIGLLIVGFIVRRRRS